MRFDLVQIDAQQGGGSHAVREYAFTACFIDRRLLCIREHNAEAFTPGRDGCRQTNRSAADYENIGPALHRCSLTAVLRLRSLSRMAIQAVIFDLGRVIVPFDFRRGYERIAPLCGLRPEAIPKRIATSGLVDRFESGGIGSRDFVRELSKLLGFEIGYEEFCSIWSSIFLPETLVPESMVAGIARRYRTILLSNTNAIHFAMLRANYPLLRHFHAFVLSYEVGAMKPLPAIYRRAIEEARCRPEECFFTDDMPAYVEAARTHGIDAVQFESAAQIARELHHRGVEWE